MNEKYYSLEYIKSGLQKSMKQYILSSDGQTGFQLVRTWFKYVTLPLNSLIFYIRLALKNHV